MVTRLAVILTFCASLVYAAESPSPSPSPTPAATPTEASVKQLLEVAQSHKLVDSVMLQMESLMQQTIVEATKGKPIPAKLQKNIDQRHDELVALMKELLDWKKIEPMYVRIYQQTFTQPEVDGMIAFYKTPAGQAVIGKMPMAMQTTIDEMQGLMGPAMQKLQQTQLDIVAELKAENKK